MDSTKAKEFGVIDRVSALHCIGRLSSFVHALEHALLIKKPMLDYCFLDSLAWPGEGYG